MSSYEQVHWYGLEVRRPLDRLGRLSFHRSQDVALLKLLLPGKETRIGEKRKALKELSVIRIKEEWRTGQEDQILEELYQSSYINNTSGSYSGIGSHPVFLSLMNFESTIDAILKPRSFRRPVQVTDANTGVLQKRGDKKSGKGRKKIKIASWPRLSSLNLVRQNGLTAHVETLMEHVNSFRRIVRESKLKRKDSYKALLAMIENSRAQYTSLVAQIKNTYRKRKSAKNKAPSTKLNALKAHAMAAIIQSTWKKFKNRKSFRSKLQGIRNVERFCLKHVAREDDRVATTTCQCVLRVILVRLKYTEKRRLYRINRLTRLFAVRRIECWYRFRSRLRKSAKLWKSKERATKKYWNKIAREKKQRLVVVQTTARGWFARRKLFWKRAFARLRERRRQFSDWRERKKRQIVREVEESMVLTKFYVAKELEKVDQKIELEHKRFAAEWKQAQQKINAPLQGNKRKIPLGWTSYYDAEKGIEMYKNFKTGLSQPENPLVKKNRQIMRTKMLEAQKKLNTKLGEYAAFSLRLKSGQTAKLKALEDEKWKIIYSYLKSTSVQLARTSLALNVDGSIRH